MIIIYSNDERNGIPSATLFAQKGFDNIFLLSGGIEEFVKTYPEYCEGPGVQQLINAKAHEELMKKEGKLYFNLLALSKNTKSKIAKKNEIDDKSKRSSSISNYEFRKATFSSRLSTTSNQTKNTINNLKKNLKK